MMILHVLRTSSQSGRRRVLAATRALSTTRIVHAEVVSSQSKSAGASAGTSSSDGTEKFSFQAETNQLLSIVTNSLYTDRQVFIR